MDPHSFEYANLANLKFIEELYSQYLSDPSSVDDSWKYFFEGMQMAGAMQRVLPKMPSQESAPSKSLSKSDYGSLDLIEAYRKYGHLAAKINPVLPNTEKEDIEHLSIESHGFSANDTETAVPTFGFLDKESASLSELVEALDATYSSSIGLEYDHCSFEIKEYIKSSFEPFLRSPLSSEEKSLVMEDLNKAEMFESFIHLKYPGQKRFSLEGGEATIPMVREILDKSADLGVSEAVFGMAHRGRLNVLANIMKKPYSIMFYEFEPTYIPDSFGGSGDVKYHLGLVADIETSHGKPLKVTLSANPSHLESVDPVIVGMAKAKRDMSGGNVLPILIHGDASVAGQGVVFETMQLSQVEGYETGGTIHIVINNQVGFTATEKEARSTLYATDVAKPFGSPVFHVNGDDPEACVYAGRLAAEIRAKFKIDVFLEIVCYRKYGHNEGDEPAFTLPHYYNIIRKKENVRILYKEKLLAENVLSSEKVEELESGFREELEKAFSETKEMVEKKKTSKKKGAKELSKKEVFKSVDTTHSKEKFDQYIEAIASLPEGFSVHRKIQRILAERVAAIKEGKGIDWGLAEYLAYASLVTDKHPVRISGQDSQRGTFSHRHATIVDQTSGEKYFPLDHLSKDQAHFTAYNSPLSEYGVLGFEFGYAYVCKEGLTIWEAQFGDFANGAQIIIDTYVTSSETKWGLKCGLVMMLPHGAEGQGPEHSSARVERFLQLCSCYNMHVIMPTKPSQVFHALRRQVLSGTNIPLVVFMPKKLLRYGPSLSHIEEFTEGQFQDLIDDDDEYKSATRVLVCSGKIYYELLEEREKRKANHIAIVRIEQLYPFNRDKMKEILSSYKQMKECYYVQEEHSNSGAYEYIASQFNEILPNKINLCYVGRVRSASPAAGSNALYQKERIKLLKQAFGES
ncbi:MAG: 2-oxoglutarate dehydrogenase E1 component [Chlamydiia bacterium]|nr:2-oxoglutarate dehydrogenase E1 component [Chlamydiia bacterium]